RQATREPEPPPRRATRGEEGPSGKGRRSRSLRRRSIPRSPAPVSAGATAARFRFFRRLPDIRRSPGAAREGRTPARKTRRPAPSKDGSCGWRDRRESDGVDAGGSRRGGASFAGRSIGGSDEVKRKGPGSRPGLDDRERGSNQYIPPIPPA